MTRSAAAIITTVTWFEINRDDEQAPPPPLPLPPLPLPSRGAAQRFFNSHSAVMQGRGEATTLFKNRTTQISV